MKALVIQAVNLAIEAWKNGKIPMVVVPNQSYSLILEQEILGHLAVNIGYADDKSSLMYPDIDLLITLYANTFADHSLEMAKKLLKQSRLPSWVDLGPNRKVWSGVAIWA